MWNYKIIRTEDKSAESGYIYQIHELYYNKKKKIDGWTADPVKPFGSSKEELIHTLIMMLNDIHNQPVYEKVKNKLKEVTE